MRNLDIIKNSAEKNNLYTFFKGNSFFEKSNVKLKYNYWHGKRSDWSLEFNCDNLKDVFGINDPLFDVKYNMAISGDGQEAKKIKTLHSSSLVSLLTFYSVSESNPMFFEINGREERFTYSAFEVKNEVEHGSGNYSNMDVVLYGDEMLLYLESKFSEYLTHNSIEVKKTDYYDKIYARLSDALQKAHVCLKDDDKGKRILCKAGKQSVYCGGLKQMISHYLGVRTEIQKGVLGNDGRKIALGEILFDFHPFVPKAEDKLEAYEEAYSALKEGLIRCAREDGTGLIINDIKTYQSVLANEKNYSYVKNLPESIIEFYGFKHQ